jgi:Domain of unknown function (DUF5060)/Protein of unknown function (DUF4038)/Domain of unknown function (DUF5605)
LKSDSTEVPLWELFEASFEGPRGGNPFVDVELSAEFSQGHRQIRVTGFYDGDGVYRLRFMPDTQGQWQFRTTSNVAALDARHGTFHCTGPAGGHGPVRVRNRFHFAHADGTPYFPFGTTCYAWTHQSEAMQSQTLATLAKTRFNKIRMGVFPKHYLYNENEPLHRMFEQRPDGSEDFSRPNVAAFQQFDKQVHALMKMGIEADVIVFHPYDRWGYCTMSLDEDCRYLRYLVARLAGYRNVWWSLANEYDFLLDVKPMSTWDCFFHVIEEHDPHRHLMAIHNGDVTMNYNHRQPWVSHACIQNWDVKRTLEWRQEWGKPIVNDEPEYEGNIHKPWGNLSAQELVHRFWTTVTRGGYAGHGETYKQSDDALWWGKGGALHGQAWQRIGFLRDIVEQHVVNGLTPLAEDGRGEWKRISGARDGDFRLLYFGEHQPVEWAVGLPMEDGDFQIDLIDTWAMTITALERAPLPPSPALRQRNGVIGGGKPEAAFAVRLPGKPYMAVRVQRRS